MTDKIGAPGKFQVEELDDETYGGLAFYGVFGDYTQVPVPVC